MKRTRLEDFDRRRDEMNLKALELASSIALLEDIAEGNALMAHPVTRYVQTSPAQSFTGYPAISESYESIFSQIAHRKIKKEATRKADMIRPGTGPNMIWSLPGQDHSISTSRCGCYRDQSGNMPVKVCENNPKDYLKAVGNHCGSFRCHNCMNYAAMMAGVRIEDKLMTPADLRARSGDRLSAAKHWVVSPPQEWMKSMMQRSDSFCGVVDDIIALLQAAGMSEGVIVFHPWRLHEDENRWILSPHFHVVGVGRLHNQKLRNMLAELDHERHIWNEDGKTETWLFKQLHAGEPVKSVKHTLGYILTHAGLGSFDYDPDWDVAADDVLIPAVKKGRDRIAKEIPLSVYNMGWKDAGLYDEHLDEFDWLEWSEKTITGTVPTFRYFGEVNRLRVLSRYTERVERTCPECGGRILLCQNLKDITPVPVEYTRRSIIRMWKEDAEIVRSYYSDHAEELADGGYTVLDLALAIPQCSTPETKGIQDLIRSKTVQERAAAHDRVIVYVPSHYGQGLDPVVMTKDEYKKYRKTMKITKTEKTTKSTKITKKQEVSA